MGDTEAFAFLGAWLQAGKGLSKMEHFKYEPTPFEVHEFARSHEWFQDGVWEPYSVAGSCT